MIIRRKKKRREGGRVTGTERAGKRE